MDEFNNYNSDQSTSDNGYNTDFTQSNDYYNQYGNEPPQGKGKAIAGTICGGIGALVGLVTTIINFVNISNGENELYNTLMSQLEGAIQLIIK